MAATNDFLKTIKNANDAARAHIIKAQERQKKGYDGLREELSFKVGDLVKLSTKDTPIEKGPAYKLKPRYVGPLDVLKVVSPVAYRITLPESGASIMCSMFLAYVHGMRLQKCAPSRLNCRHRRCPCMMTSYVISML